MVVANTLPTPTFVCVSSFPLRNRTSLPYAPERMCGYRSGRPQVAPPIDRRRSAMRGRKNPPLDLTPVPDGTPLTFDTMAHAYLEDYVLQQYRTLSTARPRVEHLRVFFGGWTTEAITADSVRRYQLHRRERGAQAATINRETSALSRMFQIAIRAANSNGCRFFPNRLEENPPREGFFEHAEYLKVRAHAPASYQDVLDFAYYSGWRRNEILNLTWEDVDLTAA